MASPLAANVSHTHAGECDTVSAELKEAQKAGAELMQDREELSAQLAGLEQQLADMTQAHDDVKCAFTAAQLPLLQTMRLNAELPLHAACDASRALQGYEQLSGMAVAVPKFSSCSSNSDLKQNATFTSYMAPTHIQVRAAAYLHLPLVLRPSRIEVLLQARL